jgi:hypothetical protein
LFKGPDGQIRSKECDYSAYDSTQREAIQRLLLKIYATVGAPSHILETFKAQLRLALKVRYGDSRQYSFKVWLKECQTATGKPDTCPGNTLINIHCSIKVMCGLTYDAFGLEAKVTVHERWSDGTFLKGFWCQSVTGDYAWNYLPSLALKLVKSFDMKVSKPEGIAQVLSSIGWASSPLVRTLCQRFSNNSLRRDTDFKILVTSFRVLNEMSLSSFMEKRYGVQGTHLIQALDHLLVAAPLGSEVYHPAWSLLAKRDYGDGKALEW